MATIGGEEYTNFRAVNLRGSILLRMQADPSAGTFRVDHIEANRAWSFPDKSGRFPISGTFAVNLPAVTSFGETAVTVSGIRPEDGLVVTVQNQAATVTTGRTFPILTGARAQAGYIDLTFYNPTGTATLYSDLVLAYTAVR